MSIKIFFYSKKKAAINEKLLKAAINEKLLKEKASDRRTFATDEEYWSYPTNRLFKRIGAKSMLMEVDSVGTFVAGALADAVARDFIRLGQLYLQVRVPVPIPLPRGLRPHPLELCAPIPYRIAPAPPRALQPHPLQDRVPIP